ncbi:beta strand repeat-containing protein [Tahibacter sp. UC22_41]|uniref:beta strand repeat-containing protein n=1 Tax=Tahibacter sp. UC22_41 TaxID=3350178 RepID=UPI0036DC38C0
MSNRLSLLAGLTLALTASAAAQAGAVGVEAVASVAIKTTAHEEATPMSLPFVPSVASNYAFTTTTTGSLADMSSGTTQLLAGNIDDTASALTNIGFEFIFQGTRYTQFSINENGVLRLGAGAQTGSPYQPLAQANLPIITAYGADQRTHIGDGKIHYRVTGSAPSRTLTVEWLNNQSNFSATGGTADLTYQVQLREGTGVIDFVYGSMTMSTAGSTDPNSNKPNIGFSSSNVAGTVGSVTAPAGSEPTFNGSLSTATANVYSAGAITALSSAANGSRRTMTFTPPVTAAPTGLNFTGLGPSTMTLNWTDSSNELSYAIYRSADGVNYLPFGTAAQNATSFSATGLVASTNYFWQVVAVGEGNASAPLSGSQSTSATNGVSSTAVGGNWSNPLTWSGGTVPTNFDAVTISAGATVIIDTAAVAYSVNVANSAILRWDSVTARTLVADGPVVNDGTFDTPATGTITTHLLTVGADLTNNGILDFSTNTNTAGAGITFAGRENNTFGGNGTTTDVRTLTLNKSANPTSVLEVNPANFTVQGVATDVAGFVTLTNGMLKLSGSFPLTNRMFTTAGYSIGATAGFWLNNPNATVAAQNGSPTVSGRLRISQGVYNIGTASGNSMGFSAGANITVDGGTVNAAGRFGVAAAANAISYTQSGGTITVSTSGNTSTTLASFDLGQSTGSAIAVSGGTVVVQLANTGGSGPRDYRNQAGGGVAGITGGTVQFGNAASGTAKAFSAAGVFPNVIVNTASGNHSVTMLAPAVYNNLIGNLTINTGGTFSTGTAAFLFYGDTITNNGTLNSSGAGTQFIVFRPATNVLYQGSGNVTAPMTSLSLQNDLNFTIDPAANSIVAARINFFSGNIVNANKLTLGNNASAVIQIGNSTTPTNGGGFDVAPNFNLGAGTQTLLYLRTGTSLTTGFEVNPARVLSTMTYDDDNASHVLTMAGGDISVSATLALTNGRIVTGANKLTLGGSGTVTRTAGYVDGTFAKTVTTAASKTLEVGTANGYSPVVANVTAGTFPLAVEGSAVQSVMPNFAPASKAITRHWRVNAPAGTTADLTFSYLDGDVPVTATETNLHLYNGVPNPPTSFTDLGGTLDTGANTMAATAVSQFGYFSLAEAGAGTAADLSITKTDGVTQAETGQILTYTITVNNPGSVAVNGATVSDTPDANLTCGSWICAATGGASCGIPSGTGTLSDVPSLPAAGSVTYTQQCTVATVSAAATVGNTATVTLPAGFVDAVPGNNSATDTDALIRLVNASITKTDGSPMTSPGAPITYTIVAGNSGPNTATTTVSDTFAATLTGCTWTCAAASGSCGAPSGSGNIADVGSIQVGGTLTYTASCTVSPSASSGVSNTATVAVGSSERDTDTANNTATDFDVIIALPDVAVTMTDNRQFVRVGESLSYAITVSNGGGNLTTAVVNDPLPAVLGSGSWTCVPTGGATCASGTGNTLNDTATLPAASQVSYVYSATVLPGSPDDRIVNTVTATVSGDPNTANNTATDNDVIVLFKNGFESAPVTLIEQGADGYAANRLRVDPQLLAGLGSEPGRRGHRPRCERCRAVHPGARALQRSGRAAQRAA